MLVAKKATYGHLRVWLEGETFDYEGERERGFDLKGERQRRSWGNKALRALIHWGDVFKNGERERERESVCVCVCVCSNELKGSWEK